MTGRDESQTVSRKGRPPKEGGSGERGAGIQSLQRAAALLDAVAARPEGIGLADLSVQVGLHTSTAFHLIKTLVSLGLLLQDDDTRRYRIGPRVFMLAAGAREENTLVAFGTPILEKLSAATRDAAHLAIRVQHDIIVVARTEATGLLTLSDRTGALRPPHAPAIGKALMAAMGEEELEAMVHAIGRPRFTPATLTEPAALLAEVARVRKEEIAHDRGELDPDVRCMAVPVRDFSGRTVAAIGISGPVWRMSDAALEEKERMLRSAADELSNLLGGEGRRAAS